jgi:hypothetical protein
MMYLCFVFFDQFYSFHNKLSFCVMSLSIAASTISDITRKSIL